MVGVVILEIIVLGTIIGKCTMDVDVVWENNF